ncbi:SDR family oxidoreductase [Olivibacter sp. SDN3]|nr:SDR family oxidoreductase [Olivibacter sp. SDN3]
MKSSEKTEILITGATGTIGSEICRQLSKKGIPFRAMSRKRETMKEIEKLQGAEIVLADFNDSASLEKALEGIKHAFLLTDSSEHTEQLQLNFVTMAKKAGLEHLVKLSQLHAAKDSPVRFLRYHAQVEEAIENSGMVYTFLRPNLFMQGLLGFKTPIAQQGKFFATIGDARISLIDIRDIAAVAVETLQGNAHYNKIYNLTGPAAMTHPEIADSFSMALGNTIDYIQISDEEMLKTLSAVGFPHWQAQGLVEDYAHYARGEAEDITNDVQHVTGKKARSFKDFLADYQDYFRRDH